MLEKWLNEDPGAFETAFIKDNKVYGNSRPRQREDPQV